MIPLIPVDTQEGQLVAFGSVGMQMDWLPPSTNTLFAPVTEDQLNVGVVDKLTAPLEGELSLVPLRVKYPQP